MVHSDRVFWILIRQQNTDLSLTNFTPLETFVPDWVSVDVAYEVFVFRVAKELTHLLSGVMGLQDDSMSVLGPVVNMEQLLAKVVECLYHDLPWDN